MDKTSIALVAVLMLATSLAPAVYADEEQHEPTADEMAGLDAEREARIAEFLASVDAPSALDAETAAELFVAQALGEENTPADLLELAKFMRDAADPAADRSVAEAFAGGAAHGYLAASGLDIARDLVADDAGFDALVADGAFERATFEETLAMLAPLGIDPAGVDRNQDLVAAFDGLEESLPVIQLGGPWGQEHWDALGTAATVVQLVLAGTLPVGGSNFLPHNLRLNIAYIAAKITTGSWGDFRRGAVWAQLDVDDVLGIAFDIRMNTDTLALQLPLSIRTELNWELVCWGWVCFYIFWISITLPQTVMAVNPTWEFAVPAMAGGLATRAESSDLLMVIYDRLGTIDTQKPREATSAPWNPPSPAPPLPDHPGLGDLGTQSPIVNFYGLQADFSKVPPTPPTPPTPADPLVPNVHKRQRGDFSLPGDSTGVTAGYTASIVRAWHLNLMAVRLGSAGLGTATAPEPPATFYYDSGANIFTGSGLMYVSDWSAKNDLNL